MQNDKKQVSFLPFNALNEFMRPDYRQSVVNAALRAIPELPENKRTELNKLIKKLVKVAGFRNSLQAPLPLKLKPTITAFEKNPAVVVAILSAWAAANPILEANMYQLLTDRGWEVLPLNTDRTKLPGFLTTWPANDDFQVINNAYHDAYPGTSESSDDISLMSVWISGRLPLDKQEDKPEES